MKKLLIILFVLILLPSLVYAKAAVISAYGLTGGAAGDLDNVECEDILSDNTDRAIATGDMAIVNDSTGVYHYTYDSTGADAESSPTIIVPDDRADCGGTGQWDLDWKVVTTADTIDTDVGGTNQDSSGWTGMIKVDDGTWSTATPDADYQEYDADIAKTDVAEDVTASWDFEAGIRVGTYRQKYLKDQLVVSVPTRQQWEDFWVDGIAYDPLTIGSAIITGGADIDFVEGTPDTITDDGSGFVTAGFEDGMLIKVTTTTNNNAYFVVADVTAGTLTLQSDETVTGEVDTSAVIEGAFPYQVRQVGDSLIGIEKANADIISRGVSVSQTPLTDAAADFSTTFIGDYLYGGTFICDTTGTIQLPVMEEGMNFTIVTVGDIEVIVDTNAADGYLLDGTTNAEGKNLTNLSTSGDIVVIQYYTTDDWLMTSNGWTPEA